MGKAKAQAAPNPDEMSMKLLKACKDDEVKKAEEAVAKGAELNWKNEKGHTAAHVAAAFGALNCLVYLHKQGADLTLKNDKRQTPLAAAQHIGEDEAAALIEALLAGKSEAEIKGLLGGEDAADETPELPVKEITPDVTPRDMPPHTPVSAAAPVKGVSFNETVQTVDVSDSGPDAGKLSGKTSDPSAMRWADVYGHGKNTEGVAGKDGSLTVKTSPGVECWVMAVGEETLVNSDSFSYHIVASRFDTADAMLLGVVDGTAASGKESRHARGAYYNPRSGEVWVLDKNRVTQRITLDPANFRLFGKAEGAEVHLQVVDDGALMLRVDSGAEVVVPVALPETVRPCARLGKVGDSVALRKAKPGGRRAERASNDSVISMPA